MKIIGKYKKAEKFKRNENSKERRDVGERNKNIR